ncbi:hypothetical protein AMTRI_Chr04g185600 [Amborella trichopoda]
MPSSSLSSLYNAPLLSQCSQIQKAMSLSRTMRERFEPKTYISNKLAVGLCSVGRVEEAVELLNEINQNSCEKPEILYIYRCHRWKIYADFISHANLLHGLLKWNAIKMGLQIYDQMSRIEFEPCLCRLSLCKEISEVDVERLMEKALSIPRAIIENGHPPKRMTYNTVIKVLCTKGRIDDGANECDETHVRQTSPKGRVPYQQPAEILVKETEFCEASTI